MAIKEMSRVRNPKKPDHRYFDSKHITELDQKSEPYEYFVSAYFNYVLNRMKSFSGKFEELKEISSETSEKQVVSRLKKAKSAISLGLKCIIADKEQHNLITGVAIQQLANDLKDMWKLFAEKLSPIITGIGQYSGEKASTNDILSLLAFLKETESEIKSYFLKSSKAYDPMRIKIPKFDIDAAAKDSGISAEKLSEKIATLSNLSGGYCPNDDDADEYDDNDDDDDDDVGSYTPDHDSVGDNELDDDESNNDREDDDDDEDEDEDEEDEDVVDEDDDDHGDDDLSSKVVSTSGAKSSLDGDDFDDSRKELVGTEVDDHDREITTKNSTPEKSGDVARSPTLLKTGNVKDNKEDDKQSDDDDDEDDDDEDDEDDDDDDDAYDDNEEDDDDEEDDNEEKDDEDDDEDYGDDDNEEDDDGDNDEDEDEDDNIDE
jgi:HIV Tat-specific factor 1